MTTRIANPQLDREDIEDVRATRRDFMAARAIPVDFVIRVPSGADPHFGTPRYAEKIVTVSAVVQGIQESDRLLRLGGKIRTGDLKLIIHNADAVRVGVDRIRDSVVVVPAGPFGTRYLPDVLVEEGLGLPNRIELGLVLA